MKHIIALALAAAFATPALADQFVNGYTRKDGTYVQPHYRSNPDGTTLNNYSAPGNINPYTGNSGSFNQGQQPANPRPFASPYQEGTQNQRGF